MEIKGENQIPLLILALKQSSNRWYIRGRGRRRFSIPHYSFLAAKSNSDSVVRHIWPRDTTSPFCYIILSPFIKDSETKPILFVILYYHHFDYQLHVLEVHYKVTKRMAIVKINVVVCYSHY